MTIDMLSYTEIKELAELLESWLGEYVEEIIYLGVNEVNEILENETAMMMLKELKKRQDQERESRVMTIKFMLDEISKNGKAEKEWRIHSHVLEHSKSYRDVLYDMYLRNWNNPGLKGGDKQ